MDRRVFLRDASAMALSAAWPKHRLGLALGERALRAGAVPRAPAVAVFDPTLAQGCMLAREAARAGCLAWAIGDVCDIGTLWHVCVARGIDRGATLIAALRPSDRFVLARLASARGITLRDFA